VRGQKNLPSHQRDDAGGRDSAAFCFVRQRVFPGRCMIGWFQGASDCEDGAVKRL
jgi:hypothetical protein